MTGKWTIYWSPEGRAIANGVEAKNARQAIRKAPKHYRQYLGEMYAVCENPNAYVAIVTLPYFVEGFLLGGTRHHESTPFESEEHAIAWAKQAVEVNRNRPGYESADIRHEIVGVIADNPIKASEVLA